MGFFDLNIPYHESDRHVTDKRSIQAKRLKLTLKAMDLGYAGVAYNRTIKGVMSDSQRCTTTLFSISKIKPSSSSFFDSVKFHRQLLKVPVTAPFRQYTRLTVVVDAPSQVSALNAGNPVLKSYDFVAVRPMNQNAFDQSCQNAEVELIAIDFSEKLPFRLKQPMVTAAIKRGVFFEITYSGLITDQQSRRQMMSNCKLLVDWTKGRNLIFSSAAPTVSELRGPKDIANLVYLLGLPLERARAAISKNCRSLLAGALRKRQFYKEAIKVEEIPSGKQVDAEKSPFEEWLKWDPISSAEGDLLLDEMEKSFAEANNVAAKAVKPINFSSAMNGLPVHGFQVKDIISLTKEDLDPPQANHLEPSTMDIDDVDSVSEKNVKECVSPLPELDVLGNPSSNAMIIDDLMPVKVNQGGEPCVDSVKIGSQTLGLENTICEPWHAVTKSNHKPSASVLDEKPDELFEANFVPSTTQIEGIQPQVTSPDEIAGIIPNDHSSVEVSCPLEKSSLSAANLDESCIDNRCDLGRCTRESAVMGKIEENADTESRKEPHHASESVGTLEQSNLSAVLSKPSSGENRSDLHSCDEELNSERNEGLPLSSFDGSARNSYVDRAQCQGMTDESITLDNSVSTEELSCSTKNLDVAVSEDSITGYIGLNKYQSGRGKRRRSSALLFPFKRLHFKRKARK